MSVLDKMAKNFGLAIGSETAAMEGVKPFVVPLDPSLTWALHGGFARDRINVLAGESGSGKTFLAMQMAAQLQKETDQYVAVIDTEYYFYERPDRVKRLAEVHGLNIEKLIIKSTNDPSDAFKLLKDLEDYADDICAWVIDSLGGVSTKAKEDKIEKGETEAAGNAYGGDAKMIANTVRIMSRLGAEHHVTFFCVQHTMDSMDMYDPKPKIKGGKVLRLLSDTMILLSTPNNKKSRIGEDGEIANSKTNSFVGKAVRVLVDKCRDGVEGRKCEFKVNFETGKMFNIEESLFDVASQIGVIYHPEGKGNSYWAIDVDGEKHIKYNKGPIIELLGDKKIYNSILEQCLNSKKKAFEDLEVTDYKLED